MCTARKKFPHWASSAPEPPSPVLCKGFVSLPGDCSLKGVTKQCLWSPFFWRNHSWSSDVRGPGWINMQSLSVQVRKLCVPCLAARIGDYKPRTNDESSGLGMNPGLHPESQWYWVLEALFCSCLCRTKEAWNCLLSSERQPFLDSTVLPEKCVITCQFNCPVFTW